MPDLKPKKGETIFEYLERIIPPEDKINLVRYEIEPILQLAVMEERYEEAAEMRDFIKQGELLLTGKITKQFKRNIRLTCLQSCGFDIRDERDRLGKALKRMGVTLEFEEPSVLTGSHTRNIGVFLRTILPPQVKELIQQELREQQDQATKNADYNKAAYFRDQAEKGLLPHESRIVRLITKMLGLVAAENCGCNVEEDMASAGKVLDKKGINSGIVLQKIKERFPSQRQAPFH